MFCNGCGTSLGEGSHFCSRCGRPLAASTTERLALPSPSRQSSLPTLGKFLAVAVAIAGGFLWFAPTRGHEPETLPQPSQDALSASRLRAAVAFCDSGARAKLYLPDTMEFVSDPKAEEMSSFMISVECEIAARDKFGTRYRYRYMCSAAADGKGGIGQVFVELLPSND